MGKINVNLNVNGLPEVKRAYEDFKEKYINQLVKTGARRAGQRTVRLVRVDTQKNDLTGQLSKSRGMKYKFYRSTNVWIVLVGARAGYRAYHPFWGVIDPTRYDHLVEGGRKQVVAGLRTSMRRGRLISRNTGKTFLAIKVKTLRNPSMPHSRFSAPGLLRLQLLIPPAGRPGGRQSHGTPGNLSSRIRRLLRKQFGMNFHVRQGKKVAGGYIIFAKFASAVAGHKPVEKNRLPFAYIAANEIPDEIRAGIPRLLAKYGNRIFK